MIPGIGRLASTGYLSFLEPSRSSCYLVEESRFTQNYTSPYLRIHVLSLREARGLAERRRGPQPPRKRKRATPPMPRNGDNERNSCYYSGWAWREGSESRVIVQEPRFATSQVEAGRKNSQSKP